MWSLGFVVAELAAGYPLYPGDTDYDILRYIIKTQAHPTDYILDQGQGTACYFHEQSNSQQLWKFKIPQKFANRTDYHS